MRSIASCQSTETAGAGVTVCAPRTSSGSAPSGRSRHSRSAGYATAFRGGADGHNVEQIPRTVHGTALERGQCNHTLHAGDKASAWLLRWTSNPPNRFSEKCSGTRRSCRRRCKAIRVMRYLILRAPCGNPVSDGVGVPVRPAADQPRVPARWRISRRHRPSVRWSCRPTVRRSRWRARHPSRRRRRCPSRG